MFKNVNSVNTSRLVILTVLILILGVFSYSVLQKEQLLKTGDQILLELAPVDPRSLMQGDYMVLNYHVPVGIEDEAKKQTEGKLVYTLLLPQRVATLLRIYESGSLLKPGEKLLHYRFRNRRVQLGANSFFFQEGKADNFSNAKFGELRVNANGNAILVGLRDAKHQLLGLSSGL